jgi:hypothetical protein
MEQIAKQCKNHHHIYIFKLILVCNVKTGTLKKRDNKGKIQIMDMKFFREIQNVLIDLEQKLL